MKVGWMCLRPQIQAARVKMHMCITQVCWLWAIEVHGGEKGRKCTCLDGALYTTGCWCSEGVCYTPLPFTIGSA